MRQWSIYFSHSWWKKENLLSLENLDFFVKNYGSFSLFILIQYQNSNLSVTASMITYCHLFTLYVNPMYGYHWAGGSFYGNAVPVLSYEYQKKEQPGGNHKMLYWMFSALMQLTRPTSCTSNICCDGWCFCNNCHSISLLTGIDMLLYRIFLWLCTNPN